MIEPKRRRAAASRFKPTFALLACVVAIAASRVATLAQDAEPSAAPAQASALRVGIAPVYPPIAFLENGSPAGLEVDLAHKAGEELGKPVVFEVLEWEQLIPALLQKKVDVVMSGMSVTKERAQLVAFTEPYMRVGQMALIRPEDVSRLSPESNLRKAAVRVGVVGGTTAEAFARKSLSKATVKTYPGADDAVAALRAKQIDVFIHDAPTIWRFSLNPNERDLLALYQPLTEEYLAWAVRKDDTALKAALDKIVLRWKQSGWLDGAVKKRIPVRIEVKQLGSPGPE